MPDNLICPACGKVCKNNAGYGMHCSQHAKDGELIAVKVKTQYGASNGVYRFKLPETKEKQNVCI